MYPYPFVQISCEQTNINVNTFMYLTTHSEFRTQEVIAIDLGKIGQWRRFISIPPSQEP